MAITAFKQIYTAERARKALVLKQLLFSLICYKHTV
jgi:hypothetical protein